MRKVFLFFLLLLFVSLLAINQVQSLGIVADDPEEQIETWSENEIAKVSRRSVRPGLGASSVVEIDGPAMRFLMRLSLVSNGFTSEEAANLVPIPTLRGEWKKEPLVKTVAQREAFLSKVAQVAKDKKSAQQDLTSASTLATSTDLATDNKLKEMNKIIDELKGLVATSATTSTDPETKSDGDRLKAVEVRLDDEKTGLAATYQLAQGASDGLVQTNQRLDDMDRAWGEVVQKTDAAIRQVDRKVKVVNAKAGNLAVAQTYLSSPDGKERKKGLGLLYLVRNGKFRTKNAKDAAKYSAGLSLPNQVDSTIDINKEVLPEEKKDSPSGEKKCE